MYFTYPMLLLAVYCALIVLASLAGGWLPLLVRITHARMQIMMSCVAGLMLGVALFHLLPHSFAETGSLDQSIAWLMVGLLLMFFLIRAFHFHQHDVIDDPDDGDGPTHSGHSHDHDHDHDHPHSHGHGRPHNLSWLGVALGLSLHTLIDGLALAASVAADSAHNSDSMFLGIGTFLAIALHKPLDAMSITSLMRAAGWSVGWRQAINTGFALMVPLGAALFTLSIVQFTDSASTILGCALGFAAGVFLCISLSDLLPELQFHAHDRVKLSVALLLGVAVAYGIGFLEPEHAHGPNPNTEEPGSHNQAHETEEVQ